MQPIEITSTDRLLNNFAERSFRDVADGDYIAARLAYRAQLFSQFLWSSQQAIEKLLKCILLQYRIPAPRVRHDLGRALSLLEASMPFPLKLSDMTRKFVAYLDQVGPWRYLEVSYYVRDFEIFKLDHAVWEIRRYAEPHDFWIKSPDGNLVHMLPFGIRKIQRSEKMAPKHFPGVDGLLEKIVGDRTHAAREPLLWQNGFFGLKARKTVRLRGHTSAVNAPLFLHPEILDEVARYVLIPGQVADAYRALAEQNKAERPGQR